MKTLYIARHTGQDNDDEGAIAYALRKLGCDVTCVDEGSPRRPATIREDTSGYDFALFHKAHPSTIHGLKCPSAFWYFDMVRSVESDPSLEARSATRVQWMSDILRIPTVVAGFCTDGDWVDNHVKLVHLTQGADERVTGPGVPVGPGPDILFTGMKHHGRRRADHIDHLTRRWGDRFRHVGDGGPKARIHGRKLADLLCSAKVVISPDGPCTDRYWSNRVYLTTGFGAFMTHPYCKGLETEYGTTELVTYQSREEADELIDYALSHPEWRRVKADAGYRATTERHLYRHRCQKLLGVMGERI